MGIPVIDSLTIPSDEVLRANQGYLGRTWRGSIGVCWGRVSGLGRRAWGSEPLTSNPQTDAPQPCLPERVVIMIPIQGLGPRIEDLRLGFILVFALPRPFRQG